MARTTKALATETKRAMATNSDTTSNGYHCPLTSAVVAVAAAVVVGKDDKAMAAYFCMVQW